MAVYPLPNNPRVALVRMLFSRDTRQLMNTFHVVADAALTSSDLTSIANLAYGWWTSYYKQCVPGGVTLTQIQVRKHDPLDPLAYDRNISPAEAGTRPGTLEAGNVSVTMSERTNKAGRRFRGRMYVPGVSETDTSADDRIGSVLAGLLSVAIAQLLAAYTGGGYSLAVFHRPGLIPKPWDNLFEKVTAYVVENIVDSMRKRLPSRGR